MRKGGYIFSEWARHRCDVGNSTRFVPGFEEFRAGPVKEEVEELKEVVRREVFTTSAGDFSHQLKFIDAIQRLGMAYHFESEIEEALERMHAAFHDHDFSDDGDLYNVALGFRLLRQHGYKVSCDNQADVFNKFKDENGSFKECLIVDVQGMLSLYEAGQKY
ncbi:unnamed protein product [Prunus armeniaca]